MLARSLIFRAQDDSAKIEKNCFNFQTRLYFFFLVLEALFFGAGFFAAGLTAAFLTG
jgi:hypothetical protein